MKPHSIPAPPVLAATLALAIAAALPPPADAQSRPVELSIDVATHAAPGMPGGGLFGRLAGTTAAGKPSYGMARHPGLPGRYLDIALYNPASPGTPAQQAVPKGLRLGSRLDLLAPERAGAHVSGSADGAVNPAFADGGTFRVRYYWGCGEHARKGQPVEYSVTVRNGKPVQSGRAMQPRFTPEHIDIDRGYVLWPNQASRERVGARASLAGSHQVSGDRLPAGMQFELAAAQDFMPELETEPRDNDSGGITLHWEGVDGAQAYFAHATVADGDTVVMWSSSEDGYAGHEMLDYLPSSKVAQWTGKRTLMGAGARECAIPAEVLAGEGMPMVQLAAHGSEHTLSGDGWRARVRTKSTAMLMPGAGKAARDALKPSAKDAAKGMLRGLFGR